LYVIYITKDTKKWGCRRPRTPYRTARNIIRPFRRTFPGSSSTRSGGFAARAASMFATATALTTPIAAATWIVERGPCATGSRYARLTKTKQDLHDHVLARTSCSSATGSIDNSRCGFFLHRSFAPSGRTARTRHWIGLSFGVREGGDSIQFPRDCRTAEAAVADLCRKRAQTSSGV
jgi:hypothetical protein